MDMNALIPLHNPDPAVLFAPLGLDPLIELIGREARALVPDLSTAASRDAIASNAAKVARAKTYLDGLGKDYVSVLKEMPKQVDAERKRMRDALDAIKEEVRAPLTAWEEERKAVERLQGETIRWLASMGNDTATASVEDLEARITALEDKALLASDLGNRLTEAVELRDERIAMLRAIITGRKAIEEQAKAALEQAAIQAKVEQAEREARIAQEAAEQATMQAQERIHSLEQALTAKADNTQPPAHAAPNLDRDSRGAIHREIVADLCDLGIPSDWAVSLVRAIAAGRIAHLTIHY